MGLAGYMINQVQMEEMEVLAAVLTNGTSSDGYPNREMIGVVRSKLGHLGIYRGSTDDKFPPASAHNTVLHLSQDGKNLSTVLRELADACEGITHN